MIYPKIDLHFGHRIPRYISMFPARNNESAQYSNILNSPVAMYFSAYANIPNAKNPTTTKVKYNFFRRLIRSLGFILSLFQPPFPRENRMMDAPISACHHAIMPYISASRRFSFNTVPLHGDLPDTRHQPRPRNGRRPHAVVRPRSGDASIAGSCFTEPHGTQEGSRVV